MNLIAASLLVLVGCIIGLSSAVRVGDIVRTHGFTVNTSLNEKFGFVEKIEIEKIDGETEIT